MHVYNSIGVYVCLIVFVSVYVDLVGTKDPQHQPFPPSW